MAHSLLLGMTESGKTTLAKRLARSYRQKGIKVIVLDPLADPEWNADFQTDDGNDFLSVFWNSRHCMVFIDESGDAIGRYDTEMIKTATRGRHWGHSCHYLSQRGAQLSSTVRDQCTNLFLFTSGLRDRKLLSEEFDSEELLTPLQRGAFWQTTRFTSARMGRVF